MFSFGSWLKIKFNLTRNAYRPFLIDKVIKKYLNYKFSSNQSQFRDTSGVHFIRLSYIGNLWHHNKNELSRLWKEFCKKTFSIKLVFKSFKMENYFSYKDPIPDDLKYFLVYKFTFASYSSSNIDNIGLRNIKKDKSSNVSKHLQSTTTCFDSYHSLSFKLIDKAHWKCNLKIEESLHINWRKPNLNAQQNRLALTLSLKVVSHLFSAFVFVVVVVVIVVVFCVFLSSIIFIISDTSYQHQHLSFSSLFFIISTLNITNFVLIS